MTYIPTASYPICRLCGEHVELETANTDEKGQAVHENCYVTQIVATTWRGVDVSPVMFLSDEENKQVTWYGLAVEK